MFLRILQYLQQKTCAGYQTCNFVKRKLQYKCKLQKKLQNIAQRNAKILWKVIKIHYYLRWTWVPQDTSTQATSENIRYKQGMCMKFKTTVFFMWLASWDTDIFVFIDYDLWELCNIWFSRTTLGVSLYRIIIGGTTLLQLLPVTVWQMIPWKVNLI